MKFTVDVTETINRTTTYMVDAATQEAARIKVEEHRWDKMKILETIDFDGQIDEIHSVKPFIK
jgi:hypothetical protein